MRELILATMTLINAQNTGGQFFLPILIKLKKIRVHPWPRIYWKRQNERTGQT